MSSHREVHQHLTYVTYPIPSSPGKHSILEKTSTGAPGFIIAVQANQLGRIMNVLIQKER